MKVPNIVALVNANLAKKTKIAKNAVAKIASAKIVIVATNN